MRKRMISLLLVSLMVLSLAGCKSAGNDGKDNSLKYIQDKGELVMGLDDTFAPMGFRDDNNEIVGFDVDLAKAVCEKLGVELKLQPVDWTSKDQELATKSVDCIWNGLSVTEDNKKSMTMSDTYMLNEITLVVAKDSGITSKEDMAGKALAVQSGSSAAETLDSEVNKEFKDSLGGINEFSQYSTALMDLESGNSDAVLMDSVMANYMIAEAGKDYVVLDVTLLEDEYAVGFRKGDEALCTAVEDALKELKEDGTLAEISKKWFGTDITTIK